MYSHSLKRHYGIKQTERHSGHLNGGRLYVITVQYILDEMPPANLPSSFRVEMPQPFGDRH